MKWSALFFLFLSVDGVCCIGNGALRNSLVFLPCGNYGWQVQGYTCHSYWDGMPLFYLFQNWYHFLYTPISGGELLPFTGSFISSVCFSSEMGRWRVGLHWSSVFMTTAGYCRSNHWFPVGWNGSTYPPCFQIYSRLVLCRNSGYRCLYIDLPKTLGWLLWVQNPNPTPTSEADEVSE